MGLILLFMEKHELKSVNCSLKKFSYSDNYITVTEWVNGEGWTITIGDKMFDLHMGELKAINYLTTVLDYDL